MALQMQHEVVGEFSRARVEKLVRIYHSAQDAALACYVTQASMARMARRYGLKFRQVSPEMGQADAHCQ